MSVTVQFVYTIGIPPLTSKGMVYMVTSVFLFISYVAECHMNILNEKKKWEVFIYC